MGSIFQSAGLEQTDSQKNKTQVSSERESTIAHLLFSFGYASAQVDQPTASAYSQSTDSKPYLLKPVSDTTASVVRAAESLTIGTQAPLIRSALTTNLLSPEPGLLKAQVAPADPTCRNLMQCDTAAPRLSNNGQPEVPILRVLKESAQVPVAQTADGSAGTSAPAPRYDTAATAPKTPPVYEPAAIIPARVEPANQPTVDSKPAPQNLTRDSQNQISTPAIKPDVSPQTVPIAAISSGTQINTTITSPIRNDGYIASRTDIATGIQPPAIQPTILQPQANRPETLPLSSNKVDVVPAPLTQRTESGVIPRSESAPTNPLTAPQTVGRSEIGNPTVRDSIPAREVPATIQNPPRSAVMAQASTEAGAIPVRQVAATWNDQLNRFNYNDVVTPPRSNQTTDRQPATAPNPVPGSPLPTTISSDSLSARTTAALPGGTDKQPSLNLDTTNSRQNSTTDSTSVTRNTQPMPGDTGTVVRPGTNSPDNTQFAKPGQPTTVDTQTVAKPGPTNPLEPSKPGLPGPIDSATNRTAPTDRTGIDSTRNAIDSRTPIPGDTAQRNTPVTNTDGKLIDGALRPGVTDGRGQDVTRTPAADPLRPSSLENPRGTAEAKPTDLPRAGQDARTADNARIGADPRLQDSAKIGIDGRTPDASRTGVDGRTPDASRPGIDARTPDASRTGIDARTPDASRTGIDGRTPDASRPGIDARTPDASRTGIDARTPDASRTGIDARTPDASRPGIDARTSDASRTGIDARTPDASRPGIDARTPDASRTGIDARTPDASRTGQEFRPADSQRTNTTDGVNRAEANRTTNDGITRQSDQRGDQARGDIRPDSQVGKFEAGRTETGIRAGSELSQQKAGELRSDVSPAKPGEVRSENTATRGIEQRNEISANRNNETRGETSGTRTNEASKIVETTGIRNNEARLDATANKQPDNTQIRTDIVSGRTDSTKVDSTNSRSDNAAIKVDSGSGRTDNPGIKNDGMAARNDIPSTRTDTGSARTDNPGIKTDNSVVRTDNPAIKNEISAARTDNPGIKNDSSSVRTDNVGIKNDSSAARTDNAGIKNDSSTVRPDITGIKTDSNAVRTDNPGIKTDSSTVRTDITGIKNDSSSVRTDITGIKNDSSSVRTDNAASKFDGIVVKNESPIVKPDGANNIKIDSALSQSPIQNDSSAPKQNGSKIADGIDSSKIADRVGIPPEGAKPTPFGFPADVVATHKEAAAIRQVLNELRQNQNLSPSEVLELPSFKEAIRLLDALKTRDADSHQDVKQHFTTSFVEAMRLSDFLKVLERADEVQQKRIHKQQWAARSIAQTQHRVRYLVQREDTLESIAQKILGDVRFVQLLVTINRAEIIFTVVNGKSVSTVYEGQYLWIPTPNEVAIHRKHYFNANGAALRGEPIAPEDPTPIRVEEYEAPTTVRDFATRLKPLTAPQVMTPEGPVSSPMALVLYRLRFAGNRNSVNLDEVPEDEQESAQPSNRRHHKVRLGETLQSIAVNDELLKDVNMWVLICQINNLSTAVDVVGRPRVQINRGDILLLPNQEEIEEFKLLKKLTEIAQLSGKELDVDLTRKPAPAKASPHCKIDRQMSIEKLWERCRMILTDNDDTSYSIKLQRDTLEGRWTTVAAYESKNGKTVRWTYKIDGARTCLEVGLPAAVSREMAIEDFQRNWRFYYNRYTAITTDTLELLDLSEAAL
ncbi:MAG: hypothetical protein EKK48_15125 [Candidatus Melainabacteria bacterium]|nr:MAG: hypothetical protein EKK48_15125 [Candidatus Melainabacteria bacterium]